MSWKVRRASAKTIEAMVCFTRITEFACIDRFFSTNSFEAILQIVSRRDQLPLSVQTLGPLLISRLREREENVRIDIYNAYIAILSQARLVVPNALAAVHVSHTFRILIRMFHPNHVLRYISATSRRSACVNTRRSNLVFFFSALI